MAVLALGRHQQRNGGPEWRYAVLEILETDIVREADSLEVRGVGLEEAFSGLGPVRSGCDRAEAFAGTGWKNEIANACDTASVPSS